MMRPKSLEMVRHSDKASVKRGAEASSADSTRRRRGASSSGSTLAALARKGPSPKLAPCAPRRSSLGERRGEAVRGQREVGSAAECAREMSGPLLLGEKCLSLGAEVRLAA